MTAIIKKVLCTIEVLFFFSPLQLENINRLYWFKHGLNTLYLTKMEQSLRHTISVLNNIILLN